MKRRSLIKSIAAAAIGAPMISFNKPKSDKNLSLKKIKHNPIGVSTYSFWQFNGQNAGKTVLQTALSRFSRQSKQEIPHFSLPNFNENFSDTDGIINKKLSEELDKQISIFSSQVDNLLYSSNN